jgi:hypothetical protein
MDITTKLDELAELRASLDVVALEKQAAIDSVYTPEIHAKISDIEIEFAGKAQVAIEKAAALEAEIKDAVIEGGETVKGSFLMAVWAKGRTSWDTKGLDKAIQLIPTLAQYKSEGSPSVSIRKVV